ncbi:acyltransferase family protein [Hymenobacter norwichensis]|uniref:acyltransferase family protein n=1 Tax=Hymenobacter norwichensis TaxID=223903 RepID=UPI00040697B0|nr:acyltransferase [Hymenobacter norwichensis]
MSSPPSSDCAVPSTTQYFPALTGIRAVAAFIVLLFHLNPLTYAYQPYVLIRWLNYFIEQLHVGVPIFFVLSGFLLANRYITSTELTASWLKLYLWKRFIRIYPIYFILTIATFLLIQYTLEANAGAWHAPGFSYKDKIATVFLNVTLLKAFFKTYLTTGISTAWSLTVEENFYFLTPFLFVSLRRSSRYLLLYPIMLVSTGSLLVFIASLSPRYIYGFMDSMNFMLRFTFFGRCAEFMSGIGLALYISKVARRSSVSSTFTMIGVLGIIFCIILLAIIKFNHVPTQVWPTSGWSIICQNFILPLFVSTLFYGLICEKSFIQRVLSTPLFSILGKSSYVLYLIHIGPIENAFTYYISDNVLLKLVTYYLTSILIFTWIEEPIRIRLLRHKPFYFSLK